MKRWAEAAWVAAALAVSLLALAVFPRQDRGDAARLEAAISAAEAGQGGTDPKAFERELRAHLDRQPRDARGWVILARLQAERDRFDEAAQAYERAIALSSRVARDPAVWCEYADALGMARGGRLEGRPRELIDRALALDSRHPKALELAGSAELEQGRYAAALGFWRPLLGQLRPGTRRHDELAAAIARTERLAGTRPAGGPLSVSSTRAR